MPYLLITHKVCNGSHQRFRGKVSTQNCVRDSVWSEVSFVRQKGDKALNPLDAHDKRYGKLSILFLLVWYYLFRE